MFQIPKVIFWYFDYRERDRIEFNPFSCLTFANISKWATSVPLWWLSTDLAQLLLITYIGLICWENSAIGISGIWHIWHICSEHGWILLLMSYTLIVNPFYPNWSSKPHLDSQARATAIIKSNFIELNLKYYSITMLFLFKFSECSLMTRQGGWRWPQSSITYWGIATDAWFSDTHDTQAERCRGHTG